jgi:hypothetical protein
MVELKKHMEDQSSQIGILKDVNLQLEQELQTTTKQHQQLQSSFVQQNDRYDELLTNITNRQS